MLMLMLLYLRGLVGDFPTLSCVSVCVSCGCKKKKNGPRRTNQQSNDITPETLKALGRWGRKSCTHERVEGLLPNRTVPAFDQKHDECTPIVGGAWLLKTSTIDLI